MKSLLLGLLLCVGASSTFAAPTITYSNPILPGDYPDPSIVRVGSNYWASATSSEWGPLFPIFQSRDLVNWQLVGHVFPHKPKWSSQNYWAPEISYHKGKFYVYYVGRKDVKGGMLSISVATAENPAGPWTDHGPLIGQDEGSIDGMAIVVDGDERYMVWKGDGNSRRLPTIIYAQKLSDDGTKLIGEMKELFRNDSPWEGAIIEGPFVFKRGDFFYIFYAGGNGCCGKNCNYGTGVARSKNITGPYEKCPANPVLTNNDQWKCPGHGSLVSTPEGRDYFIYHAYDMKGGHFTGRQGMLDEVTWGADNWPVINGGKGPSSSAPSPYGRAQQHEPEFTDDFSSAELTMRWEWPHSFEPVAKVDKGQLILGSSSERGDDLFASVVGIQTTSADYATTTLIDAREMKPGTVAGLFAFGDRLNALGITVASDKVSVIRRVKNKTETVASIDAPKTEKTYLRLEAHAGHLFRFQVWSGIKWVDVGPGMDLEGDFLPPWDRGIRIALTAGGNPNAEAKFDWVRYVPAAQ